MKKINWFFILSAIVYFVQGIEGLPGASIFFYFKETLGLSAEKIMYISSITGLAWLIKPIIGFLGDNYLTKKSWIIISLFGSLLVALLCGLLPILPVFLLVILITISSSNAAIRDVAIDGISCVEGKENNTCGNIQAVQWTAITIASIFVGIGGGYIAEKFNYQVGFLCLIPIYIIILFVTNKFKQPKKETIKQTVCSYRELFTNKQFLLACLFLFLYKYSPSFGTPLAFIERDVFGWSKLWMGTLETIFSIASIVGAILFYHYCKKIDVKKWIKISVWAGAFTSLSYLYFTPVTAIIYGVSFSVMGMMIHLIIMTWMAKTSLPGKEATSFALLASISNLAATASTVSGAFLFPKIGLSPLIVLSALTSFLCLPLLKKLEIK